MYADPADKLFDRSTVLERVGDDSGLLTLLAQMFLDKWPGYFAEVRTAFESRDAAKLKLKAHSLKGAVSNFSDGPAYDRCLELEQLGRDGTFDGVESILIELEAALRRVADYLPRLMQPS